MKAVLETYKCGDYERWWTYAVFINGEKVKSTPTIYRMYTHERTAIKHGQNLMDAAISKYLTKNP